MNYWLLTTEYPPFYGGGIGTYCYLTAQMLAENGYEVSVFINDASVNNFIVEVKEQVRVIRFNPSRAGASSYLGHSANISYEFALIIKEFIALEGAPDVIEAQEYLGIAYYLLHFKKLLYDWCTNVPVLITIHSPSFLYMEYNHVSPYRYPNYWICEMERFCMQAADQLIAPSRFIIDEVLKRFQLTNNHVEIVSNPFAARHIAIGRASKEMPGNEIIFFGKLTVQKGILKLLEYFDQLWKEGFSRPLYLLGGQDIVYHPEGKSMGDLIKRKYRKYIENNLLRLEEKIPPTAISDRLSRAELVIIPSANDNLPYTVFEMMALGKILLVSRQGGQSEVIEHGIDGFVFDHKAPETFKKTLLHILQLSEKEKVEIASNAVQKVNQTFGLPTIFKQKQEVILKIKERKHNAVKQFPFIRQKGVEPPTHSLIYGDLLSIVIPYYNMGQYIDETIDSVLATSYTNKEVIIVNDGSTEKFSLEKLEKYRGKSGVKVIDTENSGLANARNRGAKEAKGSFLAFLDADDGVAIDYYAKAIKVLSFYTNLHFVGCWTQYFENSANTWPAFTPEPPMILYHNTINSSALVYRRDGFLIGGQNDAGMTFQGWEDYESVLSMLHKGFAGVVLPEPLFRYRVRKGSMVRALSRNKKLFLSQYISNKYERLYATFAADVFNLQNANGPGFLIDNPTLDYHLTDNLPFGGALSRRIISLIKKNQVAKRAAYKIYKLINQ